MRRLGPFSQAAIPAIDSLGEAAKTGTPAVTDARPVIADLRALAKSIRPVGTNLREVLESFRDTEGIQRLMDYIYFQATAINGYDATGHYLRAGLLVNACTTYAVRPVSGCSANYPQGATSSSVKAVASGVDGVGEDPLLRATAIAIARALGQQVEEEKAKIDSTLTSPSARARAARASGSRRPPAGRRRPRPPRRLQAAPGGSAPAPAPTTAAAAPTAAPATTAAPAAAAPTAAAPAPTATPDPADGLLDFLFGKEDGG